MSKHYRKPLAGGGSRIIRRGAGGRFEKSTLENTFGLRTAPCPDCGALNPYSRAEPTRDQWGNIHPFSMNVWERPETCSQCGKPLPEEE